MMESQAGSTSRGASTRRDVLGKARRRRGCRWHFPELCIFAAELGFSLFTPTG